MTTLTSFFKTDNVDDHVANDVNELIAAALRAEFANTETITATKELTDNDCQFQYITASGANRTVELAPEATTNHVQAIYNSGPTYNVVVKDDSGTYTFATLAPDEWAVFTPFNAEGWRTWAQPEEKYKLSVTVSANDLIVALKHLDDTDPTATRPLCIPIAGVKRYVTAATSITLADGTSWFNMGSDELKTKEVDLFLYAIWDSNSSVVAIGPARIPYATLVSDFSATTTNEKYLGNYANYTSTDDVVVLGRFAATLSAGAGYTWTVPTFTSANLIHKPIFETRWLTWTPATTCSGSLTYTSITNSWFLYKLTPNKLDYSFRQTGTLGGSASNIIYNTVPFDLARAATASVACGFGFTAGGVVANGSSVSGTPDQIAITKYDLSNYATSGANVNSMQGFYEI